MTQRLSDLADAEERRAAVQSSARGFLEREWSPGKLRTLIESESAVFATELWDEMRRLGWHELDPLAAQTRDALGAAELCAIVEETGRALAPTPLVPCVVGHALLRASHASSDPALPVLTHREAERTHDGLRTTVRASSHADGFRLAGAKCFIPYGFEADLLIVSTDAGLFRVNPNAEGLHRAPLDVLDGSPIAEIRLDDVEVPSSARLASGAESERVLRGALSLEVLLRCAEIVGVAARALELAVEYAKQRIAFDRPIGSFQAVQHKLVDLRGHVEVARALVLDAADATGPDRNATVSMAAFAALDGLRRVPEGALQVFGGVGVTWEHDIHFFLKRAATLTSLLGERQTFREDVVRSFEAEER